MAVSSPARPITLRGSGKIRGFAYCVILHPTIFPRSTISRLARQKAVSFACSITTPKSSSLSWLTEMMRYAVRDDVGAVGAKLLYEDGSIQHAGVAVGIGGAAGHSHRFLRNDEPGYFRLAHAAHFVSAVTAACLVVEKRKFLAIGGLDEENLAVAFNDVDFCLKLQAAGWRNVYTPHAVLVHHEFEVARETDLAPAHVDRFRGTSFEGTPGSLGHPNGTATRYTIQTSTVTVRLSSFACESVNLASPSRHFPGRSDRGIAAVPGDARRAGIQRDGSGRPRSISTSAGMR